MFATEHIETTLSLILPISLCTRPRHTILEGIHIIQGPLAYVSLWREKRGRIMIVLYTRAIIFREANVLSTVIKHLIRENGEQVCSRVTHMLEEACTNAMLIIQYCLNSTSPTRSVRSPTAAQSFINQSQMQQPSSRCSVELRKCVIAHMACLDWSGQSLLSEKSRSSPANLP